MNTERTPGSVYQDKYKIISNLGKGGLSRVYKVEDIKTKRVWAMKEYSLDNPDVARTNLQNESEVLKKLKHRAIPYIVDVYLEDDSMVVVMDYVRGTSLSKYISDRRSISKGHLSIREIRRIVCQICDVLTYLHTLTPPIIYRDIKPGNIMLLDDEEINLIDFGTIREYKEGSTEDEDALGTPYYASPEQSRKIKMQTDCRSDIYSLGVTMFEMATGLKASGFESCVQTAPMDSEAIRRIILKCTAYLPKDRFQSAAELKHAMINYEKYEDEALCKPKKESGISAVVTLLGLAMLTCGQILLVLKQYLAGMILLILSVPVIAIGLIQYIKNRKIIKNIESDRKRTFGEYGNWK